MFNSELKSKIESLEYWVKILRDARWEQENKINMLLSYLDVKELRIPETNKLVPRKPNLTEEIKVVY